MKTDKTAIIMDVVTKRGSVTETKKMLSGIYHFICWGKFANEYFDKSGAWMYDKLNEREGKDPEVKFTEAERDQLKGALCDFAERIRKTADNI